MRWRAGPPPSVRRCGRWFGSRAAFASGHLRSLRAAIHAGGARSPPIAGEWSRTDVTCLNFSSPASPLLRGEESHTARRPAGEENTIMKRPMAINRTAVRFFALLTAASVACAPALASVLNLAVPRSGYQVVRDLPYGTDPRQRLDIYVPDGLSTKAPVILFFYGGFWQSGSKSLYLYLGQAFASEGIIVAVADYRLYPQV